MTDQRTQANSDSAGGHERRRVIVMILVLFALVAASLFFIGKVIMDHRRANAAQLAAPAIANDVAILPDGNIVFAPNGSIAQVLTDWLETNDGRPRYFEVGGRQFAGKAVVPTAAAQARLPQLVKMMEAYPALKLVIVGHTEDRGSDAENEVVSRRRAEWLEQFLVSKGVSQKRLSVRAAGARQPITSDETQAGREANNRIGLYMLPSG